MCLSPSLQKLRERGCHQEDKKRDAVFTREVGDLNHPRLLRLRVGERTHEKTGE